MKYILMLLAVIFSASCFDKSEDVGNSINQSESVEVKPVVEEVVRLSARMSRDVGYC